jgi:hypothetical protein
MTALRQELLRLAGEVAEDSLPTAVEALRSLPTEPGISKDSPDPALADSPRPSWFDVGMSRTPGVSERVDELLAADGFGTD